MNQRNIRLLRVDYLLNMFPQMRTSSSSPNNHHPTPKPNMFPRMRTSSLSPNNQQPTPKPKHVPSDAHFIIITEQSTPITQAKHVPSDAHFYIISQQSTPITQTKHVPSDSNFTSSPNNQHPTPKPNMFPQMRTLHHHPTINTQHPSQTCSLGCALYIITEQSILNSQTKHVPSDAHFTSSPNSQHSTAMTVIQ